MPNLRFAAKKERRVALVTGGARGIGGATAQRMHCQRKGAMSRLPMCWQMRAQRWSQKLKRWDSAACSSRPM